MGELPRPINQQRRQRYETFRTANVVQLTPIVKRSLLRFLLRFTTKSAVIGGKRQI